MSQREILFKAKRADNGNWIQGNLTVNETTGQHMIMHVWPEHPDLYDFRTVIPETVCQYTGLTDKNGKKIFEGDVLSFYNDKPFTPWVAEVKWMHCEYYLDGVNRPSRVFLSDFLPEEMTITGSIHDN